LVVDDGSLDILPDCFTLLNCCSLCCRPFDLQFVDYSQFPDGPLIPEPVEPTVSSSSIHASWTLPQAELESNDIANINNVFFGSESPHTIPQAINQLQQGERALFDVDDDFLQDHTNERFLDPSLKPFEMDIPDMAYIGQPNLGLGVPEPGCLFMNEHDNFPAVPNSISSNASPMVHEPVQKGDIQPSAATTSVEAPTSHTTQVSDSRQMANLPSPAGQFTCRWLDCQTPFNRLAELRHHVRSHTKMAQRCLWDGCRRPPEPTSSLNKHLDSHTKPHLCPETGCGHRAAKLRDMRRHILSHGISNGAIVFYCPASNCQYNEGRTPLLRADNARRHIRQIHSGSTMDTIARTYNT